MRERSRPRIIVAGGGVAALEAVLALQELAGGAAEVALLTASPHFEYGPLSVAEPFDLGRAHRFQLDEILGHRNIGIAVDALESVDAGERLACTTGGLKLAYDALIVAIGARRHSALPGAITFSGSSTTTEIRRLLRDAARGEIERLAYAVPGGVTWSLPAYELALMTSGHFAERGIATKVALVTPEPRPVDAFGSRASEVVEEMLRLGEIAIHSAVPVEADGTRLIVEDGEPILADSVVALPRLVAPRIGGLPRGKGGFVPVDEYCRVRGLAGVYAAGDVTSFPLKQGGLAAQEADVAAETLVADLGLGENLHPKPLRPVLRGLLLTGRAPRYLRAEVMRGRATKSTAGTDAIWWPPVKIAGRRLAPLLALHGTSGGAPPGAVALELEGSDALPGESQDDGEGNGSS